MALSRSRRSPIVVSLVIGIAIGIAVSTTATGIWTTHTACSTDSIAGWSGPLATPYLIAIPPPGGLVNWSFNVANGQNYATLSGARTASPTNSTETAVDLFNWTFSRVEARQLVGWGPSVSCPAYMLVPAKPSDGGGDALVSGPTAPGVGELSVTPTRFSYGSTPSVVINASYSRSPAASFQWSAFGNGSFSFTNLSNFNELNATTEAFFEGGQFVGLAIIVRLMTMGFGVPIHLLNGTTLIYQGSVPGDLPGVSLQSLVTYVFPALTDQGTWDVFFAGSGSPYSVGGLVFEQSA